jgi:hypothetical protein
MLRQQRLDLIEKFRTREQIEEAGVVPVSVRDPLTTV